MQCSTGNDQAEHFCTAPIKQISRLGIQCTAETAALTRESRIHQDQDPRIVVLISKFANKKYLWLTTLA